MPTGFAEPIESIDESLKDLARIHLHSDTFSVHAGQFMPVSSFQVRFRFVSRSLSVQSLVGSFLVQSFFGWLDGRFAAFGGSLTNC